MTIDVDLASGFEAFGTNTTYYAGTIRVGDQSLVLDGMTDRGDAWEDWVAGQIRAQLDLPPFPEDADDEMSLEAKVHAELGLGTIYEVSWDGEDLEFKDKYEPAPTLKPTVLRARAEKIAADVAAGFEKLLPEAFELCDREKLRDGIIRMVVLKISETLEMVEEEE